MEEGSITLPTADEVDDLQAVSILQQDRGPLVAPHDLAIQLDCDAVSRKLKVAEQLRDVEWRGKLLVLSVDDKFHEGNR